MDTNGINYEVIFQCSNCGNPFKRTIDRGKLAEQTASGVFITSDNTSIRESKVNCPNCGCVSGVFKSIHQGKLGGLTGIL